MPIDTPKLAVRVLGVAVVLAGSSAICELLFVLSMKSFGTGIPFTGTYAVVLFAALCGVVPSWPTPSRVSEAPLGWMQRALIAAEMTVVVLIVVGAFVVINGEDVREAALAGALSYLCILFVFAAWHWKANRSA